MLRKTFLLVKGPRFAIELDRSAHTYSLHIKLLPSDEIVCSVAIDPMDHTFGSAITREDLHKLGNDADVVIRELYGSSPVL